MCASRWILKQVTTVIKNIHLTFHICTDIYGHTIMSTLHKLSFRPRPHVYVFMRKRRLFCSFSPSVHTQTLIQRFRKSPFSPETETFENGFESGDFRKRRLSKMLRSRVDGRKRRLLKTVLICQESDMPSLTLLAWDSRFWLRIKLNTIKDSSDDLKFIKLTKFPNRRLVINLVISSRCKELISGIHTI